MFLYFVLMQFSYIFICLISPKVQNIKTIFIGGHFEKSPTSK